jgi:hypothetical protein
MRPGERREISNVGVKTAVRQSFSTPIFHKRVAKTTVVIHIHSPLFI